MPIFNGLHRFLNNVFELQGFRVLEVPVSHRPRQFGTTKYGTFRRAFRVLPDILGLAWMKRRWVNYQVRKTTEVGDQTDESQRTPQ